VKASLAFLFALLAGWATSAHAEVQAVDDAGRAVRLEKPAGRVISLAPGVTEMVYEAGGGDRLVAAVEHSDHPPAARALPRVGNGQKLDLERIAALKPDLILVWLHGNAAREVEQLSSLGFPMFLVEPRRIEDLPGVLERIGRLLGTGEAGKKAAERFRSRHAGLRSRFADRAQLAVFYQIADVPLLTVNDRHIISDVIRLCGGRNVFGKEPALVPQISTESVVAASPDVILAADMHGERADGARPRRAVGDAAFATWRGFSRLKAVRTGQLWLIPADTISRHGPRVLDGVEAVCIALDEARRAR
jgi:iron complex transport system substrate-binding protein